MQADLFNIAEKPIVQTLRGYQEEAVQKGVAHLLSGRKPVILVEPSGSGKSLIIGAIAGRLDGHVIVFQPSKELLEQNLAKFKMYHPKVDVGIYSASFNSKEIHKVTFCTIGSVFRKAELFKNFQYIIIDECDYGMNVYAESTMYKKFFEAVGNIPCLGLTATPYRLYHNSFGCCLRFITRTKPRVFTDVIHYTQIQDLLEQGYLAKCEYYRIKGFDTNKVKVNSTGSDYVDSSLKKHYHDIKFDNSLLDVCKRLVNAGRKKVLVFTKFVDEARLLSSELGNIASIISADTSPSVRDNIIDEFRNGDKIRILTNVGIMVTGVDVPQIDAIVLGSPMRSLRQFYQKIGRAMRPMEGKQSAWIVDMCENMNRFPPVDRLWLTKDKQGQWHYIDKLSNKAITNVYFE